MKLAIATTALALSVLTAPAFAQGKPADPGLQGRTNAFNNAGNSWSNPSPKGIFDRAANIYGDNGKGNGADPDTIGGVGLADHDPQSVGGEPDTSR